MADGDVFMHSAGGSTQRTVLTSWLGATTCTMYITAVKAAEWLTDMEPLLSPFWTSVFAGVAIVTSTLAQATTRCCVKYAVLTADGAHLKVYPYGMLGFGAGKPVSIPIPLIKFNQAFTEQKKDADALHVKVKDSKAHLIFDKPVHLGLSKVAGPGVVFDNNGVTTVALPSAVPISPAADKAAVASAGTGVDALGLLDKQIREDFKRYAALVHVLNGNTVNAAKIKSGEFQLEKMKNQLKPSGDAARSMWRSATDAASGKQYWYHELTWQTQWAPPMILAHGAAGAHASR